MDEILSRRNTTLNRDTTQSGSRSPHASQRPLAIVATLNAPITASSAL